MSGLLGHLAAVALFLISTWFVFGEIWVEGASDVIPTSGQGGTLSRISETDHQFVVWGVSRNAYTLITKPRSLYAAEQCFPAEKSLALGEPLITIGILAVIPYLLCQDPILTYNIVVGLMSMLASLAMYVLVRNWTASAGAGMIAGLLYGFNTVALKDIVHPYSSDTTWIVLAIYFAERLFSLGRWRDAFGLAIAGSLQIGTSFYSSVGALAVTVPFAAWLVARYRLRSVKPIQLIFVVLCALVAAGIVFSPYLDLQASGSLATRSQQFFIPFKGYFSFGRAYEGWLTLALVSCALVLPRRLGLRRISGDPRWVLLGGCILTAWIAAGPHSSPIPNIYQIIADRLPGFVSVRLPWKISIGIHPVVCLLAGIGAASLLAVWRWRGVRIIETLAVAGVFLSTFFPQNVGLPERPLIDAFRISPSPAAIRAYAELEALGNEGPIFEIPLPGRKTAPLWPATSPRVLYSAYHHRRTSSCNSSNQHPDGELIAKLAHEIPNSAALDRLKRIGFTTLVYHHPSDAIYFNSKLYKRIKDAADRPEGQLNFLHRTSEMTAYEIRGTHEHND